MTRVAVAGARGQVGRVLVEALRTAPDLEPAGEIEVGDDLASALKRERAEVCIDFTTPDAVFGNVTRILESGVHAVVGTTGLRADELERLDALAKERDLGCLVASNFAVGAVLMMRFAEAAAAHLPWVEIVERHHERKKDAPSGTARTTAERIARVRAEQPAPEDETETVPGVRGGRIEEVPIHSLRLPGSIAHQEVWFGGAGESLVLRHDTTDRRAFVPGVFLAVRRVGSMVGLVQGIESLL